MSITKVLDKAGYSDVQVSEDYDRGWICAIGRKRREARAERA